MKIPQKTKITLDHNEQLEQQVNNGSKTHKKDLIFLFSFAY